MRNIVAISLPESLLKKLAREAKEEHASRSEIVRNALQQHFFSREFDRLRNSAIGELAKKGITLTEDQIFDEVS
ncbi:MAG: ribbon-helix-helix protein, CopG family [Candidatus Omnitrophota bacterium]